MLSTRVLTGQDVRDDPRVAEWGRLAAAARDGEIVEPGLNDRPAERVAASV